MPVRFHLCVAVRPPGINRHAGPWMRIEAAPKEVQKQIHDYVRLISKGWAGITPANIWTEESRKKMNRFGGNTPEEGEIDIDGKRWLYGYRLMKEG